jgi:hypothetical protein
VPIDEPVAGEGEEGVSDGEDEGIEGDLCSRYLERVLDDHINAGKGVDG